ncbi:MAG: TetR/AcrR family transcriptional regulator [Peptostreptococcaceae bacterium]
MGKNSEKVLLTKQNLKIAFWSLYKSKSINKISIKEITDKAGYNRGTFYLYYQDVYHILSEIEDEILYKADMISHIMINLLVTKYNNIEDENKLFNFFKENIEYLSILLGDKGDVYFQAKLKSIFKNSIKDHLRIDAIDLPEDTIDFTLEFFISGMIGLILYYFSQNKEPNVTALKKIANTVLIQSGIKDLLK